MEPFVYGRETDKAPEGFGEPRTLLDSIRFTLGETDNPLVAAGVLFVGGTLLYAAWKVVKYLTD